MAERFNIAVEHGMNVWIREEAKRMHRTINGQIVAMLELARRLEERDRDNGPQDAA